MKKKTTLLLIIITITVINIKAQYAIVENKTVIPEFTLNDDSFRAQLDSVLFTKRKCHSYSHPNYVFYMNIKEPIAGNYLISITHGKSSWVEDRINLGIFTLKDYSFIIREEKCHTSLFTVTGENITFKYEKELRKRNNNADSYYYDELIYPEEFCHWYFSYSNNRLKIISWDDYYKNQK